MKLIGLAVMLVSACIPLLASAQPTASAAVVYARSRQTESGTPCATLGPNCFTFTVSTGQWSPQSLWDTDGWIWTTWMPSAASPLLVDIGPGEFDEFACVNAGNVTLRGAGREQTL